MSYFKRQILFLEIFLSLPRCSQIWGLLQIFGGFNFVENKSRNDDSSDAKRFAAHLKCDEGVMTIYHDENVTVVYFWHDLMHIRIKIKVNFTFCNKLRHSEPYSECFNYVLAVIRTMNSFFFFFFYGLWSQSAGKLTIHSLPWSWIL